MTPIGDVYEKDASAGWLKVANIAGPAGAGPPLLVTSLPVSPVDGQQVYYAAPQNAVWHLRYNAAIAGAYKWQFLGGSALEVVTASSGSVNTGWSNVAPWPGTDLALPLPGVYRCESVTFGYAGNSSAIMYSGLMSKAGAGPFVHTGVASADFSNIEGRGGVTGTTVATFWTATITSGIVRACFANNSGVASIYAAPAAVRAIPVLL